MRFASYLLAPALALALTSGALADTTTTEKTTATTYKGIVSTVDPSSSTIVMRSSETTTTPKTYTYNKETVFMSPQGKVVTYDQIKDSPVTISYTQDGDRVIVTKVEATGPQVRKESTTTTTTETR